MYNSLWLGEIPFLNTTSKVRIIIATFCCRDPGVDFESLIYVKPYCRIAPYLVGMVLGYLLIHSKDWRLPTKVTGHNFALVFFMLQSEVLTLPKLLLASGPIIDYQIIISFKVSTAIYLNLTQSFHLTCFDLCCILSKPICY